MIINETITVKNSSGVKVFRGGFGFPPNTSKTITIKSSVKKNEIAGCTSLKIVNAEDKKEVKKNTKKSNIEKFNERKNKQD